MIVVSSLPFISKKFFLLLIRSFSIVQFSRCIPFTQLPLCLVGSSGLEPPTSRLSGVRSNHLSYEPIQLSFGGPSPAFLDFGGDEEDRTPDPLLAGQVLSQLSYTPNSFLLWLLFAPFESLP